MYSIVVQTKFFSKKLVKTWVWIFSFVEGKNNLVQMFFFKKKYPYL